MAAGGTHLVNLVDMPIAELAPAPYNPRKDPAGSALSSAWCSHLEARNR